MQTIQNGIINLENMNETNIKTFQESTSLHRKNMSDITIKMGIVVSKFETGLKLKQVSYI